MKPSVVIDQMGDGQLQARTRGGTLVFADVENLALWLKLHFHPYIGNTPEGTTLAPGGCPTCGTVPPKQKDKP